MENLNKQRFGLFRLTVVAVYGWLMVLPATVFLAAAALRMLQPRQYEPARTSWILFEWTAAHVTRLEAAILFVGMPGIVFITGCAALLRRWRQDPALRHDSAAPFSAWPADGCRVGCRNNPHHGCDSHLHGVDDQENSRQDADCTAAHFRPRLAEADQSCEPPVHPRQFV